jgi:hypothetical protein
MVRHALASPMTNTAGQIDRIVSSPAVCAHEDDQCPYQVRRAAAGLRIFPDVVSLPMTCSRSASCAVTAKRGGRARSARRRRPRRHRPGRGRPFPMTSAVCQPGYSVGHRPAQLLAELGESDRHRHQRIAFDPELTVSTPPIHCGAVAGSPVSPTPGTRGSRPSVIAFRSCSYNWTVMLRSS